MEKRSGATSFVSNDEHVAGHPHESDAREKIFDGEYFQKI